jgi:hypothetical protein
VNEQNEAGRRALELAKDDATCEALKAGGATMSDIINTHPGRQCPSPLQSPRAQEYQYSKV